LLPVSLHTSQSLPDENEAIIVEQEGDDNLLKQKIVMPSAKYFDIEQRTAALDWLYSDGFTPNVVRDCTVLAVTNDDVDAWNADIQKRNMSSVDPVVLKSKDVLADVDDDHGHLKACLSDWLLNDFNNSAVAPPHELHLKELLH
jgi:hypothetical protein